MPEDKMPPFREELVNDAFGQDDLYVEMTFLRSMEQYGLDVSIRQAGIDFANSGYALWVANDAGRRNLRNGIAPPDSSHPKFHGCAGAIDYQIEADYAGLISPGMIDNVNALGEKFGRLMNYGDGVYAGQFIGALYAEAYFEKDIQKLIEAGLKAIPGECMYAEMVRDVVRWHKENPDDWSKTWAQVDKKYRKDRTYNISALDVKLEGAFVLIGLLYGNGDPDKTMIISCRCGGDSDCNPSSSGGVLFTTLGISKLPDRFHPQARREASLQPHGLQLPRAARRVRETHAAGDREGRRTDREGRQRRGSVPASGEIADDQQVRGPEEARADRRQPLQRSGDGADQDAGPEMGGEAARRVDALPVQPRPRIDVLGVTRQEARVRVQWHGEGREGGMCWPRASTCPRARRSCCTPRAIRNPMDGSSS